MYDSTRVRGVLPLVGVRPRGLADLPVQAFLLDERQDEDGPGELVVVVGRLGHRPVGVVVVMDGQGDLLDLVLALGAGGGLADLLDGGQQQPDQDGDDGDDDEQLDQREATPGSPSEHGTVLAGGRREPGEHRFTTIRADARRIGQLFSEISLNSEVVIA
jgi:hypothetical protein